ncbi:MAG: VIT family protein [Acidihalobacter sp.]
MSARSHHHEKHRSERTGWLRAAVLGANDGLVSVGALVLGVAASQASHSGVLIAGVSAWIAGALSMAAGEYVSVSSQADTEQADLELERRELDRYPEREREELAQIYVGRGLDAELADKVAGQLMAHNALEAHARDEIGISDTVGAKPLQAAWASSLSFTLGVVPPLLAIWLTPSAWLVPRHLPSRRTGAGRGTGARGGAAAGAGAVGRPGPAPGGGL